MWFIKRAQALRRPSEIGQKLVQIQEGKIMKILLSLIVLGSIVILAACSTAGNAPSSAESPEVQVKIINFSYDPVNLSVASGTTVQWTNEDSVPHTVTSDDGVWDSGAIAPGGTFTYTFEQAGTFAYHCTIHPNMKATIEVTP
jgi:plastocyanin